MLAWRVAVAVAVLPLFLAGRKIFNGMFKAFCSKKSLAEKIRNNATEEEFSLFRNYE